MDSLRLDRGPVVVLAPHADDESLGCGRLLATLWSGGGAAHVICLTDGAASHPASRSHPFARLRAIRRSELLRAVSRLGGISADVTFLDFPDAASHRLHGPGADMARSIGVVLDRLAPATLIAPSPLDPHCDHEAGAAAARVAAAARPGTRLLFYPVWSRWKGPRRAAPRPGGARQLAWTEGAVARKRAAIDCHRSQMGLVVRDDPNGFVMPEGFAEFFANAPELYFQEHAA
ncbi:PIG-L family deacetylase [uncultured Jannaschia sp.]|uniref:PIG-L deacetylase family protein n=1 Tax=uncultured Jannaschia sp. TaxID=293347 RepID=UPI00263A2271|nr:PIG-L family deacetylase [uncultured Jannaschia sp.]